MVSLALSAARAQVTDDFETTSCPTILCGNGLINNGCLANWATSHGTPHVFPGFFGNQGGFNSPRSLRMVYGPMNQFQWGGEGTLRTFSFKPDKCYVIKLWIFPTINASIDGIFRVRLTNNLNEDLDLGTCHEPVPNVTGITQTLLEENISNYALNNWQQLTLTFTPSDEFTQLWLYLAPTVTQTTLPIGGSIRVDDLEIIEILQPKAGFTYEIDPMCGSGLVSFSNTSQNATTYLWNFGDGETSTAENPVHAYPPGTYTVSLTASNECGTDITTQIVVVSATTYDWVVPGTTTLSNAVTLGWLPANGVTNESVQINGILTIDQDEYTFQDANVTMVPGAGIVVNSAEKLWINNSTFMGCEYLWRGIHVLAGAYIYVLDNSFMADAEFAIRTENKSEVTIQESKFDKNYISLFHEGPQPFVLHPFFGNEITCSESLLPAYPGQLTTPASKSYAGILIHDQTILSVGNENTDANHFSNLRNGIIANRSNLVVLNSKFENIAESSEYTEVTGFGIYSAATNAHELTQQGFGSSATDEVSFKNCTQAIFVSQSGAIISENHMQNVENGIRIENVANQKIEIAQNRIRSKFNGVELIGNDAAQSLGVLGNYIYIGQGQPSYVEGVGIDIMETGVEYLMRQVSGNRVYLYASNWGIRLNNAKNYSASLNHIYHKTGYGFEIDGVESSDINCNKVFGEGGGIGLSVGTSSDMNYSCNWLSNSKTGAYFEGACLTTNIETTSFFPPFRSGISYDGSIMINPQIHKGNLWYGSDADYSVGAAVNSITTNNFLDIAAVRFEVNSETPPVYPPSAVLPNAPLIPTNEWFKPTPGNLPSCPNPDTCGQQLYLPGEDKDTWEKVASGEYASSGYGGAITWQAQRQVYQQLDANPEIQNESPEFAQFYEANEQSVLGRLHNIQKGISALNRLLPEKRESLYQINQEVQARMDEIRSIDIALVQNLGAVNSALLAERQSELDAIEIQRQDATALSDLILTAQITEADILIADNATIPAIAVYEMNEKTVNGIYLETVAKGITTFTPAWEGTLKSIANQCPLSGGVSVFKARSLYAFIERAYYNDEELCATTQQMHQPQRQAFSLRNADFRTYPNPTTGAFVFEYSLENDAVLAIHDLTGRVAYSGELKAGKETLVFSSGQVFPGMYLLKVFANGEVLHVEKIIIIR